MYFSSFFCTDTWVIWLIPELIFEPPDGFLCFYCQSLENSLESKVTLIFENWKFKLLPGSKFSNSVLLNMNKPHPLFPIPLGWMVRLLPPLWPHPCPLILLWLCTMWIFSLSNGTTYFFLRKRFLTDVLPSSGTITTWVLILFVCFVFCLSQYLFSSLRYLLGCHGLRKFSCLSLSNSESTLNSPLTPDFSIQCIIK